MKLGTFALALVPVFSALLGSSPGHAAAPPAHFAMAAADANAILAEIDKRAYPFEDQKYKASMTIIRDGQVKKVLEFDMFSRGGDQQLIVFTGPGDVAGMKVLMPDAKDLYVYMPEFKKVRRVAAHVQNQGMFGSAFTYEDMTEVLLAPKYSAVLSSQEGDETTLTLTPREGVTATYAKIDVVVDKSKGGVTKLTYFDGAGKAVRQQARDGWTKVEGKLLPTKITMSNLKSGDVTVIELSDLQVNTGLDEETFSRRMLLRG
jgi:outer membrane lipoprotein-sorting protein